MKIFARAILASTVALTVPAVAREPHVCQAGEVVIDFSHAAPAQGHPVGDFAQSLAERINTEMDGAACLRVFGEGRKFDDDDVMEALLLGDVQIAAPSLVSLQAYTLHYRLFDLPFLFEDAAAVVTFKRSAAGRRLLDAMADIGFRGLGYVFHGMKQLSANRPFAYPADVKGLVFRLHPPPVAIPMFEALGAMWRDLPETETLSALQSGAIDGQENTWAAMRDQKTLDVQDGITQTDHQAMVSVLLTSDDWLNGLSPDLRTDLMAIIRDVEVDHFAATLARQDAYKNAILATNGDVRTLTSNQRSAWRNATQHLWDQYGDEVGRDLIDAALRAGDM